MKKYNWEVDVPVYMIFFNRPEPLKKVFESVKKARPSKLFLACDGPRTGRSDDIENIKTCREIVEDIDWECEVYKNYSDVNLGCGMRMYSGVSWAFEKVDRLIIIEDDCVLSQDFYRFAAELLEKYKDDDRIYMINAMNHLGVYKNTPYSYFFSAGCCWGWATWKRAWANMDFDMTFMQDDYSMKCVEHAYPYYTNAIKEGNEKLEILNKGGRLTSWTYQCGMATALNAQLCITPKVNLVTNVGLTADSTHAVSNIKKLPQVTQQYFNMPTYPLEFPLKHPKYIVVDRMYDEEVGKKFKSTIFSKIDGLVRRIIYYEKGDLKMYMKKLKKRLYS